MTSRLASLLCFSAVAACSNGQYLAEYQAADRMAWGEGTVLPAPYTTADMVVTLRVRVLFLWTTYTLAGNFAEQAIPKNPGDLGFSVNLQSLDPNAPNLVVSVPGTAIAANTVNWTMNQTFSQSGGFPFSGTFDNNGTPITFNLVLNNIAVTGNLRSDFAGVTPFYNPVLAQNSKNRGTYTGADTYNWINIVPGSVSGTVNGIAVTGLELKYRNIQHIMHVPYRPTVQGTITLNDVTSTLGEQVHWELKQAGTVVDHGAVAPGSYSISTNAPVGEYELHMKGRTHLAQMVPVTLSVNSTANFSLINGDCDGDNEVGPGDFAALTAAFGSMDGDSNWNLNADLDRDEEVGPTDFSIMSANFGLVGD